MYHSFLIHSSADGHLGWVHVLAIINSSTTYLKDNLFHHWLFLVPFPNIHWPYLVVQSLSCVQLFVAHWTTAHQASLSFTISQSLLKPMCIVSDATQPSQPLHPLLLLLSIFPSIRVFSNELVLRIRWPNYWSFSFSTSPPNEYSGLISFRMG